MTAEIICYVWIKSCKVERMLNEWDPVVFVAIYKKGDWDKDESYHQIALLSHVWK